MKWSFAATGMIILGIIGLSIIVLFEQITTNNESDYYLLKEVSEAAMIDAIDITYYRETGNLKIVKEKFVENFLRRFANSTAFTSTGYTIEFYDLYEEPPKVTIVINTGVRDYSFDYKMSENDISKDDFTVVNNLTSILEFTTANTSGKYQQKTLNRKYYFMTNSSNLNSELLIGIPDELDVSNVRNESIEVASVTNVKAISSQSEVSKAYFDTKLYFENDENRYFKLSDNSYTLSINDCGGTTGSVVKVNNSNRKLKFNLTGKNNNCSAISFDITWSYDEYEINYK